MSKDVISTIKAQDVREVSEAPVADDLVRQRLAKLPGWDLAGREIRREWKFKDHYQVMAFVNAVAWISHATDHHPDMQVGYNKVVVSFTTHSAGGITQKDLLCAEMVSRL